MDDKIFSDEDYAAALLLVSVFADPEIKGFDAFDYFPSNAEVNR